MADFSGMSNPFMANTPLMQDPTAAPPPNVLQAPTAGILPVAQQAPGEAAAAAASDPHALQQQAFAEQEAAAKQEAAAFGQQAAQATGAATQEETSINASTKAATAAYDHAIETLDQQQTQRQALTDKQVALEEQKAAALQSDEAKLDNWVANTPTRQAAAATAMHLAGPISILTALGGALTRQSGIAMLGAMNGVVQGIQQGAENKYNDAMDQWQKAYDQMKHHMDTTREVYNTYLDAYKGRIDAQDIAIQHTNSVMGTQVQKEQMKIGSAKDIFNAKEKAWDSVMKYGVAMAKIHEQRAARLQAEGAYNQGVIDLKASQLLDGVPANTVFAGMRGIKGLPFQNAVWQRAEDLWYQRPENANNPAYIGHPEVKAHDAAAWLDNAQRQAKAGERALLAAGAATGKIEFADKLLVQSLPLAQQALSQYQQKWGANKSFIPYNQMAQHAKELAGNAELRSLQVAVTQVLADYNALNIRTGTGALADRIETRRLLNEADSPQAFMSALQRMLTEAVATRKGAQQSMDPRNYGLGLTTAQGGGDEEAVGNVLSQGVGGGGASELPEGFVKD